MGNRCFASALLRLGGGPRMLEGFAQSAPAAAPGPVLGSRENQEATASQPQPDPGTTWVCPTRDFSCSLCLGWNSGGVGRFAAIGGRLHAEKQECAGRRAPSSGTGSAQRQRWDGREKQNAAPAGLPPLPERNRWNFLLVFSMLDPRFRLQYRGRRLNFPVGRQTMAGGSL
jgi:hypothetical protein